MGGLREKIKGLNRFREELATPAAPAVPFDCVRADRMIRQVMMRCEQFYRPGALDWAREERPELTGRARSAAESFEAAYRNRQPEEFRAGLQAYGRAVREIVQAFEAHQVAMVSGQPRLFPADDCAQQHRAAL